MNLKRERDLTEILQHFKPMENFNIIRYIVYHVLGWFSVTIEVFLRKNFGERYCTKSNLWVGFYVLTFFTLIGKVQVGFLQFKFGGGTFYYLWYAYILLAIFHLARIWMSHQMGNPQHSFYNGESRLEGLTKWILGFINPLIAKVAVFVGKYALPKEERKLLDKSFQLSAPIRDIEGFTKKYVEPLTVFLFAYYFTTGSLYGWLVFCGFALMMHSMIGYEIQRGQYLDVVDSMILAIDQKGEFSYNEKMKENLAIFADKVEEKLANEPELYEEIKSSAPSVAEVLATMKKETQAA